MKTVTIALVSRMDEREVRSAKILDSLLKRGHSCMVVGWNRFGDEWQPPHCTWERDVLNLPAGMGLGNAKHVLRFRKHVAEALAKRRVQVAIAVNEEVAYLTRTWRRRLFSSLVLDTHDELDQRVQTTNPVLKAVLSHVACKARDSADAILCTNPLRRDRYRAAHRQKTAILPNYPVDCGAHLWDRLPAGDFRVYIGGALGQDRGLEFLLKAAETASVRIVSAGRLMDDYAQRVFCRHPLVRYVGCLSASEAMALLADCHASVAFYAPGPEINHLASPNKVYDALCVGRPILVSDEAAVADWVERNETGYRIKYGDIQGLTAALEKLRSSSFLPEFARRARETFLQGYSWESYESVLYSAVDRALAQPQ
jgi:glycosyltransferase involved in cell wall biosynthesis